MCTAATVALMPHPACRGWFCRFLLCLFPVNMFYRHQCTLLRLSTTLLHSLFTLQLIHFTITVRTSTTVMHFLNLILYFIIFLYFSCCTKLCLRCKSNVFAKELERNAVLYLKKLETANWTHRLSESVSSLRGSALYLRLRSVEEEQACTTQEILDRHAEKMLRRTEERKRRRRRRRLERKEDVKEERRTGTGWWEAARDRPEMLAVCTERESRVALQEEGQQRSTEEADREEEPPQLQVLGTGSSGGRLGVTTHAC